LEHTQTDSGTTTPVDPADKNTAVAVRPKHSTKRGETSVKMKSVLTKHHQYAKSSCLNQIPITYVELQETYHVPKSSASRFFKNEFGNYKKYRNVYCADLNLLLAALKKLNDEYTVDHLFGGQPPQKGTDDVE
jgi:hypothetical protein